MKKREDEETGEGGEGTKGEDGKKKKRRRRFSELMHKKKKVTGGGGCWRFLPSSTLHLPSFVSLVKSKKKEEKEHNSDGKNICCLLTLTTVHIFAKIRSDGAEEEEEGLGLSAGSS